jgi:hypothetical protein
MANTDPQEGIRIIHPPLPAGVGGKAFRPIRVLNMGELDDIDINSKYTRFRNRQPNTPDAKAPISAGAPKQVLTVFATESPVVTQGRTVSLLSVIFTRDGHDKYFGSVKIYLTGYKGNTQPVAIGDSHDSPCSFLVESTNENVVVTVQAIGQDGTPAAFDKAPTTHVLLDGVISSPPNPSISQTLVSVPLGFQFSFNQVSGLTTDIVKGYKIYRGTTNVSSASSLIDTKLHDPLATGAIVVQDYPGVNLTYYYWVTSFNAAGLESGFVDAQSGTTVSEFVRYSDQDSVNVSYRPTSNPLTGHDAGASATVNIAAFTMRAGGTDISISSGSVTALSYSTLYYIYYDDNAKAGGAVTYNATTTKETAINGRGRFFVGSVKTPAAADPDTRGNNDGGTGAQSGTFVYWLPVTATTVASWLNSSGVGTTSDALDNNLATYTQNLSKVTGPSLTLSGYPPGNGNTRSFCRIEVTSQISSNPDGDTYTMAYSLNNGSSYTTIYSTSTTRAKTTDTVTLANTQDLTQVRVRLQGLILAGTNNHDIRVHDAVIREEY